MSYCQANDKKKMKNSNCLVYVKLNSTMSRQAYLRILVYTASIIMYIGNMFYMTWVNRNNPVVNEQVEQFKSLELRFFTTWTYLLQVGYAIFALGCDLFIVKNAKNKNYSLPSPITDFREIIFSGLVWPCTMVSYLFNAS
ncbi:hypothetical protein B5X24_HaOG214536 [Helicoverpa armigera]|nr:hypothetical protein B5X24_HaOG214536 [Helicoverpa armigera]